MTLSAQELESLTEMLEAARTELSRSGTDLTDWQKSFIQDQIDRFDKYGSSIFLSPKQWAKIREVHEAITGQEDEKPIGMEDDPRPQDDLDDEIPF